MRFALAFLLLPLMSISACSQEVEKTIVEQGSFEVPLEPIKAKGRMASTNAPTPEELWACKEAIGRFRAKSLAENLPPKNIDGLIKTTRECEGIAFGEIKDYGSTVYGRKRPVGELRRSPEFSQDDFNNPKYDNTALEGRDFHIVEAPPLKLSCLGVDTQGGVVMCRTQPNAKVKIGRGDDDFYYETANDEGQLLVGFDRDETRTFIEAEGKRVEYNFTPRDYDTSRIDGLPPSQVSTFSEAQLKRIRSSSARKKTGFASRAKDMGFKNGFISPIKEFRKTTNFGAQRILNGEPKKPHYGVDMAAPVGTPIYAPADGVVSLADDDLYFEGAMVLLDHGQGLISMYLHVNEITVENGQAVKQGEQIATVGSKGRSTGPHLCWRLKWRNRNLDPELLTEWPRDEH